MSQNNNPNIVLTGFMGTGKTSVGRLIADMTGRPFVDTDDLIVEKAGMSIPEIFVQHGERHFRQIEKQVCGELAQQRGLVVATGGGMLVDEDNRQTMQRSAVLVCLNADSETIEERLREEALQRPLLRNNWRELLEKRRAAYATMSYQIDTTGKSPEQVAQEIVAVIQTVWLTVDAPGGGYEIVIQPGVLARMKLHVEQFELGGKVAVVSDSTVGSLYGRALVSALPDAVLVTMGDGEKHKTLETVARIYGDFVDAGLDRSSTVIALGGGVVGDTAGFAAATYMRGARLVQAPTTLLAMVDASVGGKVGVDLPQGKNLVGAFKQPDGVLIDPDTLKTLPPREWRCGMAEIIKHGLIADESLLDGSLHTLDHAVELIRRAAQVKIDIVQQDPFEENVRAHLNLGHTFAHAFEQISGYNLLHGEAVAIGLLAAARLSQRIGLCGAELPDRVEGLLAEIGLPWRLQSVDAEALYGAMARDKKWRAGRSRFILLRGVGTPVIEPDVPKADVLAVLETLK